MGERPSESKLAVTTADAIERRIAALGWPVDLNIGSEAELIEQFGVSRVVLREAILILEQRQIAARKRGPGGGVVVRAPRSSGVAAAVARYLEYVGVRPEDLVDARLMLELYSAAKAARANDLVAAMALRNHAELGLTIKIEEVADHTTRFHALLGQMTGNPVLILFSKVLTHLASDFFQLRRATLTPDIVAGLSRRRVRIAQAIIDGSEADARHEMRGYIDEVTERFA